MKKITVLVLAFLLSCTCGYAQEYKGKLVWVDEFDYSGLPDPAKWDYEEGFVRNKELQFYTVERKENARVKDGMLILEAHKENYIFDPDTRRNQNPLGSDTASYTSAALRTKGKASWTYGRIEVRAKLPDGLGIWPAIWMLGTNIKEVGWPMCGEIDIMEYVGFQPDVIHANIHTKSYNHSQGTNKGSTINILKPYESFHVYAIDWTKDRIDFYVDVNKYFSFSNEGKGVEEWPYDLPQYLILNIAVGGSWGGQKGIDDAIFPQKMYVDFVRVYQ